jgi:hypothetical protein
MLIWISMISRFAWLIYLWFHRVISAFRVVPLFFHLFLWRRTILSMLKWSTCNIYLCAVHIYLTMREVN